MRKIPYQSLLVEADHVLRNMNHTVGRLRIRSNKDYLPSSSYLKITHNQFIVLIVAGISSPV